MVKQKKYLLDSDILITMLRDCGDKTGLRSRALREGLENCYVSIISMAELYSGAYKMNSERGMYEVEFIKSIFNVLPFGSVNTEDAESFGKAKALLCSSGLPLGDMDVLIGASALSNDMTVVTHNVKHFSRIPKLKVEDWL